jgi:hypothetical protein
VTILRLSLQNSHDQFRESKQVDKSVVDLATRAFSDEVKSLLVDLLNEGNRQVREAHQSLEGQRLLAKRDTLPFTSTSFGYQDLNDKMITEVDELAETRTRSKRTRNAPQRLATQLLAESHVYNDFSKLEASDEESFSDFTENDGSFTNETSDESDTNSDIMLGNDADDVIAPILTKGRMEKARQEYKKMSTMEQEAFDQDSFNLRMLLSLSPHHHYTLADLQDSETFHRGLRLLFSRRVGREEQSMRLGPHIRYDKLPLKVVEAIRQKMQAQPDLSDFVALLKGTRRYVSHYILRLEPIVQTGWGRSCRSVTKALK